MVFAGSRRIEKSKTFTVQTDQERSPMQKKNTQNKRNEHLKTVKQARVQMMKSLFGAVPNRHGEEVLKERLKSL